MALRHSCLVEYPFQPHISHAYPSIEIPGAGPEEVPLRHLGHGLQGAHHKFWQNRIDWRSRLGRVKEKAVFAGWRAALPAGYGEELFAEVQARVAANVGRNRVPWSVA